MSDDLENSCPLCGGPMNGVHCKLICANCGYREDCSDLFPARPAAASNDDREPPPPPTPQEPE